MTTLDELERLEKAATAGPWRVAERWWVIAPMPESLTGERAVTGGTTTEADAALIAAARNALPALLRVARAAQRWGAAELKMNPEAGAAEYTEWQDALDGLYEALAALEARDA